MYIHTGNAISQRQKNVKRFCRSFVMYVLQTIKIIALEIVHKYDDINEIGIKLNTFSTWFTAIPQVSLPSVSGACEAPFLVIILAANHSLVPFSLVPSILWSCKFCTSNHCKIQRSEHMTSRYWSCYIYLVKVGYITISTNMTNVHIHVLSVWCDFTLHHVVGCKYDIQ